MKTVATRQPVSSWRHLPPLAVSLLVAIPSVGCSETVNDLEDATNGPARDAGAGEGGGRSELSCVDGESPAPEGAAHLAWSVVSEWTASGLDGVRIAAADGIVVVGPYQGGLAIGDHAISGDGVFAAHVDEEGEVRWLTRVAGPVHTIAAVAASEDAVGVALLATDEVEIPGIPDPAVPEGGSSSVVVRLDDNGHPVSTLAIPQVRPSGLAFNGSDLLFTGETISFGLGTTVRVSAHDGGELILATNAGASYPGNAVWLRLSPAGARAGWLVEGDAGTHMAPQLAQGTSYATGRFGGFGRLTARFGPSEEHPEVTAVSSDDDPAFDGFVAGVDDTGARWAKRITAYHQLEPIHATTWEDDLFVWVSATGYDIVLEEDTPEEVRITSDQVAFAVLARYGSDGTLWWARNSPHIDRLGGDGCHLIAVARTAANAPSPTELLVMDDDGDLVAKRQLPEATAATSQAPQYTSDAKGHWFRVFTETTPDGTRLHAERIDWNH